MIHTDHLSSRIGPTHGLSLLPTGHSATTPTTPGRPTDAVAATLPNNRPNFAGAPGNAYNTLPAMISDDGATRFANGLADEFGSVQANVGNANKVVVPPSAPPTTISNPAARRPDSGGGGSRLLTVANLQPNDIPQSTPTPTRQLSTNATGSGPSSGIAQQKWLKAEDEKKLYNEARNNVLKVQGVAATPVCSQ